MDPFVYTYPSPLAGYENLPPLPEEKAEDGKSEYLSGATELSVSWTHLLYNILDEVFLIHFLSRL
jgi:hypothetical protein